MFRERPRTRLSDRIRGKSGDEVFQELRQELDKDRKMFFDSNPNWGFTPASSAFPRRHMFSDEDDLPPTSRGRSTDLKSHLEDLANRHPEFADHLRSPPGWVSGKWGGGGGRSASRDRPSFFEGQGQGQQPPTADQPASQGHEQEPLQPNSCEAGASGLSQHGLRNTVPDINSQAANEVRNQRSMSAPPDSNRSNSSAAGGPPQQRFVSKIEINPVNPATGQTAADSKPPVPPSSKPANMQSQPQHKTSTVRHIPIFVEGRDEPILPKNVDQEYVSSSPPPPHQQQQQHPQHWQQQQQPNTQQRQQHQQQPFTLSHQQFQPQRKPSQPFYQAQHQSPPPSFYQAQQHHQSASPPPPQQQRPRDQTDSAPNQQQQQQQQHQQPSPPPEQPKVDMNDPIYKVQVIQNEVDALKKQIEAFQGNTRADKEFIYLDEMLTRNLLKLDNISTEGKESIRAVRKEAINSVQKCISLLEAKIPSQDQQNMDVGDDEDKNGGEEGGAEKEVEEKKMETNNEQQVGGEEQKQMGGAESGSGVVVGPKEENNGPMEKVPKHEAQDNPNEIKC